MELGGLLEFVVDPPGPPNAPPVRHDPVVVGEPIPPLRDWDACAEGRVCDDIAEPGRFGSFEVAVIGRGPVAAPSLLNSSPSSEAISVMRDDMTLGARCDPAVGKGVGNELIVGERAEASERGPFVLLQGTYCHRKVFIVDSRKRLSFPSSEEGILLLVTRKGGPHFPNCRQSRKEKDNGQRRNMLWLIQ